MKKKTAPTRLIVWSVITLVLVGALVTGIGENITFNLGSAFVTHRYDNADQYTAASELSLSPSGIGELDINWIAGSVTIVPYGGDTIHVVETAPRDLSEGETMHYRVHGGKLILEYCRSTAGLRTLNMPAKELTVEVPYSLALQKIDVESVSAGVYIESLDLNKLDIECVSGNVELTDISASVVDMENVSGRTAIAGRFDEIDVETVSGGTTLTLSAVPRKLDIDSVSGSIEVYLPQQGGFTATLDTVSGSLSSDFAQLDGRKSASFGDGSASLRFETVSGSVRLLQGATADVPATADKPATPDKATASPAPAKPSSSAPIPAGQRSF